jgi:hypothetical protein
LGLPFQGSLASSLIRISPDILSHASSPHGRDHTCGGVSEYQSALALFPLAVAGGTTLMGFCASTIPIFDFIQARATVFASRRLVHYCHSPTIFGPNAEICRSYRDVLRRGTRAFLLRGGRTIMALTTCAASTLDSWLCVTGFHQFCFLTPRRDSGTKCHSGVCCTYPEGLV